jgi:hypothetical protein
MREVLRLLRLSGASFTATVAACVSLQPREVLTHNGLSFYGNFRQTLLPYAVGLGLTAWFALRASRLLASVGVWRQVRRLLAAMALALFGVVLTPSFSRLRVVQVLHVLCGAMVFGLQWAVARQLVQLRVSQRDYWLFRLQLLALGLVLLSFGLVGELSLMLPAQVLAIGTFGALLFRAVHRQVLPPVVKLAAPLPAQPAEKL